MTEKSNSDVPLVIGQVVDCPLEQAWEALTNGDKMRIWYFPQLIEFKPIIGFKFKFFNDGSPYQKIWQVLDVVDHESLVHSWVYDGYPGSSTVRFELAKAGIGTKIQVTHTGIYSFPNSPHFARTRFESGWRTILGINLKNFLERKN